MRFYVISDIGDALTGLRLAGIEGEFAPDEETTAAAIERAVADESIAVVLMTATAYERGGERVAQLKQSGTRPLIGSRFSARIILSFPVMVSILPSPYVICNITHRLLPVNEVFFFSVLFC